MTGRSAVIAPIVLPSRLAILRDAADPLAARGVPAHVTVLFPFLAVDALTPTVRSTLAGLAAMHPPFVAPFSRVERWEEMVWLVPAGQRPFLDLTLAVAALWPDHPPYEGVHESLIAHLTLVETTDRQARDAAWAAAVEVGPFDVAVRELTVITETESGNWRTRWRLPLGNRTTRKPSAP
ncbi:MAG: 2'-5' RNA ligase family protein [Candidatus Limnocylindrales bacterium]|jgi:2'-5' RNA ligase|nr:2'-5' RNA ligase family protein [Candidatus Limnocylindrales bacterium]